MFLDDSSEEMTDRQQSLNLKYYEYGIVIGVGGIGSWVALNLALSGQVNKLYLFDDDKVENSNLNRTPFKLTHIDRPKVLALKELILERRINLEIIACNRRFTEDSAKEIKIRYPDICPKSIVTIDCRDDSYQDLKLLPGKAWKLGYNGLEISIDGNPRETVVMGDTTGYEVTPSFLLPSQLIANLVINQVLTSKKWFDISDHKSKLIDEFDQFNTILTLNTTDLLFDLHELYNLRRLESCQDPDPSMEIQLNSPVTP